jgi:hypothetical protein
MNGKGIVSDTWLGKAFIFKRNYANDYKKSNKIVQIQ